MATDREVQQLVEAATEALDSLTALSEELPDPGTKALSDRWYLSHALQPFGTTQPGKRRLSNRTEALELAEQALDDESLIEMGPDESSQVVGTVEDVSKAIVTAFITAGLLQVRPPASFFCTVCDRFAPVTEDHSHSAVVLARQDPSARPFVPRVVPAEPEATPEEEGKWTGEY